METYYIYVLILSDYGRTAIMTGYTNARRQSHKKKMWSKNFRKVFFISSAVPIYQRHLNFKISFTKTV